MFNIKIDKNNIVAEYAETIRTSYQRELFKDDTGLCRDDTSRSIKYKTAFKKNL